MGDLWQEGCCCPGNSDWLASPHVESGQDEINTSPGAPFGQLILTGLSRCWGVPGCSVQDVNSLQGSINPGIIRPYCQLSTCLFAEAIYPTGTSTMKKFFLLCFLAASLALMAAPAFAIPPKPHTFAECKKLGATCSFFTCLTPEAPFGQCNDWRPCCFRW